MIFSLDKYECPWYDLEAVFNSVCKNKYAAIAQSVERILGKDEVASSNLASSSRKHPSPALKFSASGKDVLALHEVPLEAMRLVCLSTKRRRCFEFILQRSRFAKSAGDAID